MATCAKCGRSILWFRLADSGKSIPVNDGRVPRGNIELEDDGAHVVKPDPMVARFLPHYVTCPPYLKAQREAKEARAAARKAKAERQLDFFPSPGDTNDAPHR